MSDTKLPPLPEWLTRYGSRAQQDDIIACIEAAVRVDHARQAPVPIRDGLVALERIEQLSGDGVSPALFRRVRAALKP